MIFSFLQFFRFCSPKLSVQGTPHTELPKISFKSSKNSIPYCSNIHRRRSQRLATTSQKPQNSTDNENTNIDGKKFNVSINSNSLNENAISNNGIDSIIDDRNGNVSAKISDSQKSVTIIKVYKNSVKKRSINTNNSSTSDSIIKCNSSLKSNEFEVVETKNDNKENILPPTCMVFGTFQPKCKAFSNDNTNSKGFAIKKRRLHTVTSDNTDDEELLIPCSPIEQETLSITTNALYDLSWKFVSQREELMKRKKELGSAAIQAFPLPRSDKSKVNNTSNMVKEGRVIASKARISPDDNNCVIDSGTSKSKRFSIIQPPRKSLEEFERNSKQRKRRNWVKKVRSRAVNDAPSICLTNLNPR